MYTNTPLNKQTTLGLQCYRVPWFHGRGWRPNVGVTWGTVGVAGLGFGARSSTLILCQLFPSPASSASDGFDASNGAHHCHTTLTGLRAKDIFLNVTIHWVNWLTYLLTCPPSCQLAVSVSLAPYLPQTHAQIDLIGDFHPKLQLAQTYMGPCCPIHFQ